MNHNTTYKFSPIVQSWAVNLTWHDSIAGRDDSHGVSGQVVAKVEMVGDVFKDPTVGTFRRRTIHLDLGSSFMGVGTNIKYDQNDIRGPYITRVAYQAWVQAPNEEPDPARALAGLVRVEDTPVTANGEGSLTSSMSYSIEGSVGFFGGTPTGSESGGVTLGTSNSHSIEDFTFLNHSTATMMYHELTMTGCGDGEPYSSPGDLVNGFQSPFVGARLRALPALAKSNVPIMGQVIWQTNDARAMAFDNIDIHIAVRPSYAFVNGRNDGFVIKTCQKGWDATTQYYRVPINFRMADDDYLQTVNLKIKGGVAGGRAFLAAHADGARNELATADDESGRQQWVLVPGPVGTNWYNIIVNGGVGNGRKYLSVTADGGLVDLFYKDDGSGRQRWVLTPDPSGGDWLNITILEGVTGPNKYLSVTADGGLVDLYLQDDGSGRQRWCKKSLSV